MKTPEMKTEKRRPGRPAATEPSHRRNIFLADRLAEKAKKIGDGNVSDGIRRALESWSSQKK